ncbi:hypothetical protein J3A83DRAFT_4190119 [Scleroderma citrinum]
MACWVGDSSPVSHCLNTTVTAQLALVMASLTMVLGILGNGLTGLKISAIGPGQENLQPFLISTHGVCQHSNTMSQCWCGPMGNTILTKAMSQCCGSTLLRLVLTKASVDQCSSIFGYTTNVDDITGASQMQWY